MEGDLVLEADHDDQPRHAEDGVHAELLQRGPRHQLAGGKTRNQASKTEGINNYWGITENSGPPSCSIYKI